MADDQTDKERTLAIIRQNESGNQNVFSGVNVPGYSVQQRGSGYYQIIPSTWQEGARLAGVDTSQYPLAIDAPFGVQHRVASALYDKYGTQPWQGNPRTEAALHAENAGPAPSSDDLLKRMQRMAPQQTAPTQQTEAPEGQPAEAPSSDDLLKRIQTMRQPVAPAPGEPPGQPGEIDPITGQKFQFAGPASPEAPVAQSLGKPIAENRVPGPIAQIAGNFPTDPEARRRVFAAQLFPEMSPTEAQSHVFYGDNGRLAGVDRRGNPFYIDPEPVTTGPADIYSPRSIAENVLGSGPGIGNALSYGASGLPGAIAPTIGILAGAGGGVTGPGAMSSPALAAGGAAAGDLARQYVARYLDPNHPPIDLTQTGREAAMSAAGQAGGAMVSSVLAPNVLRVSPGERNLLSSSMPDIRQVYERAAQQSVSLTPGQATGLPSLLQYEDVARTLPGTVGPAADFYRQQGVDLQRAGQQMLSPISSVADKTAAAQQFQEGAEDAIRLARQNANAAARPFYKAAEQAGQVMSPDLAQLMDQPAVADAMTAAKKSYQNLYRTQAPDTPDFALWDLTKRQLDDAYTVAQRAGQRTDAMSIDTLRKDLATHLDTAYPTYAQARTTAAPGQALASRLEESGVGSVAGKAGDERARAIVAPVFERNNPQAISEARDAFTAAGRGDEWNAGVRSYIQDAFDRASMSQQGLNPAMLRRQVWSNVDNRDAIQAALTPDQFKGFDNFLSTIEDVARTYPMNSLTAMRLNARGALQGAAEQTPGVRAVTAAQTVLSPFRLLDVGAQALSGMRQRMIARDMQRTVGYLFSPDGLQALEAITAYRPGTLGAMEAAAQIVGRAVPPLVGPAQSANENSLVAPQSANLLRASP